MSLENVTAVREFLDAANRRDYEVVLAAIHPEVQWHSPPDIPNPEVARGRDEYVAMWRDWLDAGDDYRFTPDETWEGPGETLIVSGVESARGRDSGIDVLSRRITGVVRIRFRQVAALRCGRCLVQTGRRRSWTSRSALRPRLPASTIWPPRAGRRDSPAPAAAGAVPGCSSAATSGSALSAICRTR